MEDSASDMADGGKMGDGARRWRAENSIGFLLWKAHVGHYHRDHARDSEDISTAMLSAEQNIIEVKHTQKMSARIHPLSPPAPIIRSLFMCGLQDMHR